MIKEAYPRSGLGDLILFPLMRVIAFKLLIKKQCYGKKCSQMIRPKNLENNPSDSILIEKIIENHLPSHPMQEMVSKS